MCLYRREQVTSLHIQMDQSDDWKLQQGDGDEMFQKHRQFLPKRILQFVFSVSVFSFLLWYSFGCSILPHEESINVFFSTFIFSIFSHILERKYMFLLCNAILVLVAKTSLSISDNSYDDHLDDVESFQSANAIPVSVEATSLKADQQQQHETGNKEKVSEEADDEEEQEDAESVIEAYSAKEEADSTDETVVAENDELSNADELNRKFEEFIRKMKEEMRIEAQRQLIAV